MRRFVCPECGCDEINELSMCVVVYPVKEWSYSGEPEAFDDPEVDWDSDMPYMTGYGPANERPPRTLECSQCCEQFEIPRIIDADEPSNESDRSETGGSRAAPTKN